MLDQSFSASNFRTIYDLENRKGSFFESKDMFKDDVFELSRSKTNEIKNIIGSIKKIRRARDSKTISQKSYLFQKEVLLEIKEKCKLEKGNILNGILGSLAEFVNLPDYEFEIKKGRLFKGNQLYETINTAENHLVLKQIQYNIQQTYKIKQSDRKLIISQQSLLLDDKFPKLIIRTDIKKFYESIPHKELLKKIEQNNLLNFQSKKVIRDILKKYWNILINDGTKNTSDERVGIPRGIGVSALLSELYMRNIDRKIKSLNNVTYYSRYVDDILIIITPSFKKENTPSTQYIEEIKKIVCEYGLEINEDKDKTSFIDLRDDISTIRDSFTYLGYRFNFEKNKLQICMSSKKFKRYISKIEVSFLEYANDILKYKGKETETRRKLIQRIKFLTSNTKLSNRKGNVLIGIYFSNQFLSMPFKNLRVLDKKLKREIYSLESAVGTSPKLINTLKSFSFISGFNDRIISEFHPESFEKIIKIWKKI
nr:antiviral reverse transcriptase Drt3a [uncultured Flavobacterium sp.]